MSNQTIEYRQSSVEVSIDGRRYRAIVQIAARGDVALQMSGARLETMPPRQPFDIDRANAEDAEIIS